MPTLALSHYNLRAPRAVLAELCTFYCEVVGLTVGPRPPFASFGYWLYAGGRAVLHLSEAREPSSRSGESPFDHGAFDCSGRAEFERKLRERGIAFQTARVPQTAQVQLFFNDPAGNGVELNFAHADDA